MKTFTPAEPTPHPKHQARGKVLEAGLFPSSGVAGEGLGMREVKKSRP